MKLLAFCALLLALSLHYGDCGQITLETLPSDAQDITCTGDLQCNSSDSLCLMGDIETAEFAVLIPTDIRAKTVKRCDAKGCRLSVQVTMDMAVTFISEFSDDLGSGDCGDYEDYDDDEEDLGYETEDNNLTDVSVYFRVNKPSNDSLLCANLFILRLVETSFKCSLVRVSLPQSSIPRRTGSNNSIKVGSVIYNSINARPGNDFNITTYTHPRYNEELHIYHKLPGCTELGDSIVECEAPWLTEFSNSDNVSVGVVNETSTRNITLRFFYEAKHKRNDKIHYLYGKELYHFPKSDIVPCLCFEAWYTDLEDAVRTQLCPFKKHSGEKVVQESAFTVKIEDNTPLYNLSAPCDLSAEISLCWKAIDGSECHEIPYTRKQIVSEIIGSVNLENLHPSLCLQVTLKGKVLHTYCLPVNETKQKRIEASALVLKHKHENTYCFVGKNKCTTLEGATGQIRRAEFFEQKIVEDINAERCMKIFKSGRSNENHEFYACSVEKYMRSKWNWSRGLSLLAVACVLLVLLLKNENLKKWLKSVTTEKSLSEIFNDRRVLILYYPDNQEYENLVRVFASSLKDLQLDVVLDQWHRIKMSEIGPLPWYHQQKSIVFEKKGLIILLFSQGAREKYIVWKAQDATQHIDPDPYQSFGAVLNCVQSDFCNKTTNGQYVVATFSPSRASSVPEPFNSVPVYELPLCLEKLLKEIAGVNGKKLGHKQMNRLSSKIRDRLSNIETLKSVSANESVAVELQPLVESKSRVS